MGKLKTSHAVVTQYPINAVTHMTLLREDKQTGKFLHAFPLTPLRKTQNF